MKKLSAFKSLLPILSVVSGCSRPDHVITVRSPLIGVFYTVETFNGSGPVDPDFTRVYAHLEHDGKSNRRLVMDGGYLEISKITWVGKNDVTICLKSGVTNSFRSEVTLAVGNTSETIHNHIQEHCETTPTTIPNLSH